MLKLTRVFALTSLIVSPTFAQELADATKIEALKLAYELNGRSMIRWGTIDLTGPFPKADRIPYPRNPRKGPV